MPGLYLCKAESNDDCDALACHARNRLRSDCDDRCQPSLRHFPVVADTGLAAALPLSLSARSKRVAVLAVARELDVAGGAWERKLRRVHSANGGSTRVAR